LSFWAQSATTKRFQKWSKVPTKAGISGAQVAAEVLRNGGVEGVRIEQVGGRLTDHYDPRSRTIRLSPEVFSGTSVAAFGVAAHEAGHALQHAEGYKPLQFRSAVVPAAGLGSSFGFPLILLGALLGSMHMAVFGLVLYAGIVVFQLVTVPVEMDASRRALAVLSGRGLLATQAEEDGAKEVLTAAGLTYVAAALASLAWLLHFGLMVLGGRRS
ncbi:MAG: zinc metallopeptidase, partial [Planctomycetes bacterium]|nr:zinc metallopeptidase [Planctomycetota bacterium]